MPEMKLTQFDQKMERRTDFITYAAVLLLGLIIVGEIAFSIWLPRRLKSEKAWERETLLEAVVDLVDEMRGGCSSIKSENPDLEGEIQLTLKCLDEYAKYLRQNKLQMSMDQAVELHKSLKNFRNIYVSWKMRHSYISEEKLRTNEFLKKMLDEHSKLNIH